MSKTPGPRMLSQEEIQAIEKEIGWLENVIASQSANGLFRLKAVREAKITSEDCYIFIRTARDAMAVQSPTYQQLVSAKNALNSGWEKIDEAIETAGVVYRLRYIYALGSLAVVLLFFFGLLFIGTRYSDIKVFGLVPLQVLIAGSTGALLWYMWFIVRHVENRQYMKNWLFPTILAPFIGALLGVAVYVAYFFLVFAATGRTEVTPIFDMSSLLFSFIAGYGWRETIDMLTGLTKVILGSILKTKV